MKSWLSLLLLAASSALAADNTLRLYNWNNYIAPETLKRFEAQCKCKVVQDYYGDMETLLGKIAAGAKGYDVLVPTGFAIPPLAKQKALLPLDKKQVPNLNNVDPVYMNTEFDKGNVYAAPYAFTTTLIGFNDAKAKELGLDTGSWSVIFDPKVLAKIKGKVTVLDDPRELFAAALMYNGFSANSTNEAEWKKAQATIAAAKPFWAAFKTQGYIEELAKGNLWVVHGYSNDMFQANTDAKAAKRPFGIGFGLQKEGNTLSLDHMVISKSAPRPDLAHQFVNFMLDGKNSAELTNMIGSGNPNAAAGKFIKPELTKVSAVFPPKGAKLEQLRDLDSKSRRMMTKLWTEVKVRK
jgi:spermidine/putrescine transport system substrate-binding protein